MDEEDPLEKGMAMPHPSILAWINPWIEEPGGGHKELDINELLTLRLTLQYITEILIIAILTF